MWVFKTHPPFLFVRWWAVFAGPDCYLLCCLRMPMLPVFMILSPCFLKLHTYHVYKDLFAVHRLFTVMCFAQSVWLLSVNCLWSVLLWFWKPSAENVSGYLTWWMVFEFPKPCHLELILNPKFGCTYWLFILRPKWKLMKTLNFDFFSDKCQNYCCSFCSLFVRTNAGKFLDLQK